MAKKVKKFKMGKAKTEQKEKEVTMELLYMTEQSITVKDIKRVLEVCKEVEVDTWEEIDILEITMPSGEAVDFETMTDYIDQEDDVAFMKERNVQTVYAVLVSEKAFEEMKQYMSTVLCELGGFLCTDSEDFMPVYDFS